MVSSINSAQLLTSQIFMRVVKENSSPADSAGSATSSNDDYYDASLRNLMRTYGDSAETSDTYDRSLLLGSSAADKSEETEDAISEDISTASFMTGLKSRLEEMARSTDPIKAKEMLAALDAGTLTVTDAEAGRRLTAWNTEEDKANRTAETIIATDWSNHLKNHLSRERTGGYALSESGAHIDKPTGNSASFFTVGGIYVYLTWPTAGAAG